MFETTEHFHSHTTDHWAEGRSKRRDARTTTVAADSLGTSGGADTMEDSLEPTRNFLIARRQKLAQLRSRHNAVVGHQNLGSSQGSLEGSLDFENPPRRAVQSVRGGVNQQSHFIKSGRVTEHGDRRQWHERQRTRDGRRARDVRSTSGSMVGSPISPNPANYRKQPLWSRSHHSTPEQSGQSVSFDTDDSKPKRHQHRFPQKRQRQLRLPLARKVKENSGEFSSEMESMSTTQMASLLISTRDRRKLEQQRVVKGDRKPKTTGAISLCVVLLCFSV